MLRYFGAKLVECKEVIKMKINSVKPTIKTYPLSEFCYGDICYSATTNHYYLVVRSENNDPQLIDLIDNVILREAKNMSFMKVKAELNVLSVG